MILPGFHGFDNTEITELSLSLQKFLQMKHFKKFLTPYSTKLKLTLNPEGAQGALLKTPFRVAYILPNNFVVHAK